MMDEKNERRDFNGKSRNGNMLAAKRNMNDSSKASYKSVDNDVYFSSQARSSLRNSSSPGNVKTRNNVSLPVAGKQKKQVKNNHNRVQLKTVLAFVIVFLLCTAIGLSTVFVIRARKNNALDVSFRYSIQNKDVGTVKNIIKTDIKYAYGVYYPFFDKDNLDNKIEKQNSEIIGNFLLKYKHYRSEKKGTGAVLFSDFETTDFVDYYQIVRKSEYRIPNENTTQHIVTLFYDVKNKKVLTASDMFDSNFRQIISVKISDYFKDNTDLSEDEISSITKNKKMNIENFSFDRNNFYLYVNDLEGNTVTIKMEADSTVTSHMKIEYDKLMEFYDEAHQLNGDKTPAQLQAEEEAQKDAEEPSPLDVYIQNSPFGKKITKGIDPDKPMVALTFDDGPGGSSTERILDALEKNNSVATFFVVGSMVNEYPEIVKRAASIGCEIGNHTTVHKNLTKTSSKEDMSKYIEPLNDTVEKLTGNRPTLVRPPEGGYNDFVSQNIDYPMINWSVDTKDWSTKNYKKTFSVVKGIVESDTVNLDGQIVLMHDIYGETATAAEYIIPLLVNKGYQLVTVSDLLQLKKVQINKGQMYLAATYSSALYAYSYNGANYKTYDVLV